MSVPPDDTLVEPPALGARFPSYVGRQIAGRYVVLEEVGRGGMGRVYRAYDARLRREVALKTLHAVLAPGDSAESRGRGEGRRLLREAQAMARLSHPNVLPVFDVDCTGGTVFVAMEFVDGMHLGTWLDERPRSMAEIAGVFHRAGLGLQAAHSAGLVHRDFKPSNVLVGADGRVRVMDFGLVLIEGSESQARHAPTLMFAKVTEHESSQRLTAHGSVVGTPAYMPPEQHFRETQDARGDQYSFCVALYQALTGRYPFVGGDLLALCRAKQDRCIDGPTSAPRGVSPSLWSAMMRGLSPEPVDRWPDMGPLLAALGPRRRKRWLGVVAAVAALGSVAAAAAVVGEPAHCDAHARLATVWSDADRGALHTAFSAVGGDFGRDAAGSVTATIDQWSDDWSTAYTSACQGADEALAQVHRACLERQRRGLRAVVGVLADAPDRDIVERAAKITDGLPTVSTCLPDPGAEAAAPSLGLHAAVATIDEGLARVDALRRAGRTTEAVRLGEALLHRAARLPSRPTQRRAHDSVARAYVSASRYGEAVEAFERSFHLAVGASHAAAAAEEAIALAGVVGQQLRRPEAAMTWARHAREWIERQPSAAADQRARLRTAEGLAYLAGEDLEPARTALTDAFERIVAVHGASSMAAADALSNLSRVESRAGAHTAALEHARAALAIRGQSRGAAHPETAQGWVEYGTYHERSGNLDQATDAFERAIAIYNDIDPDHVARRVPLGRLARVMVRRGDLAAAEELAQQSLALAESTLGPAHPKLVEQLQLLAAVQTGAKRWAAVIPTLQRCTALLEGLDSRDYASEVEANTFLARAYENSKLRPQAVLAWVKAVEAAVLDGRHPGQLGYLRLRLGTRRLEQGRPELALIDLTAAARTWDEMAPAEQMPNLVAETDFALAQATWQVSMAADDALALAARSREKWVAASGPDSAPVDAIDAWVATVERSAGADVPGR
ncbi:MAG: serine/threonine-protein kinase [Myxococcota bacterium]